MLRFAIACWLAALAGASLIDLVADSLKRAFFDLEGIDLLAIVGVPTFVMIAFTAIALVAGAGKRVPKVEGTSQADPSGDIEGGALNPQGPVVVQLRELCRADTRTEIANQRSAGNLASAERAYEIAKAAIETERRRLDAESGKRPRVSKGWQTGQGASPTLSNAIVG